jgi:hypothetical protein
MQILHPFAGSVQQYNKQLSNPDAHRPSFCPQCQTQRPLSAHGFYTRTLIDLPISTLRLTSRHSILPPMTVP